MSMKNGNDTIRNRTRNLPTCSIVPQPNAPLPTPIFRKGAPKISKKPALPGKFESTATELEENYENCQFPIPSLAFAEN
jgi:hypothetical protein